MFIVRHKSVKQDGTAPAIQYGMNISATMVGKKKVEGVVMVVKVVRFIESSYRHTAPTKGKSVSQRGMSVPAIMPCAHFD